MINIYNKIKDFYYNIKGYIKNIIKWSPILWKDRNWDHYYIIDTLRFKIENTSKYIEKNKRYVGWERDVERMNLVIKLIDKFQEGYYSCEYQNYHKSKFWFEDCKNPNFKQLKIETIENNLNEYFKKYPNTYKLFFEDDDLKIALKMGNHLHNKCKRILFKLIEKNIEKWWD